MIPFYEYFLYESLRSVGVEVALGCTSYLLDPTYFSSLGVTRHTGILDIAAKLKIKNATIRRILKFTEYCTNLLALSVQFLVNAPDILHIQWLTLLTKTSVEFWFLRYARCRGIRLVYTVHNLLPHNTKSEFEDRYRKLYQLMDRLICHTESAKQALVERFGIDADRIRVIPHGPLSHGCVKPSNEQARRRLQIPDGECVVLSQGVLAPYKGLDVLLGAWQFVHERCPKARLIIAGTGKPEIMENLRRRVVELRLGASVTLDFRFIPPDEMPFLFEAADILVYPYKDVTSSGALLTGLTHGKAIVASALPVFEEILKDGCNARLVPVGAIEPLAETLSQLINNPDARARLKQNVASVNIEEAWRSIAVQTRDCYFEVVD